MLFGAGLMNLRMLSLKVLKLVEFRIAGSSLFHSIMIDGKELFLKKRRFCKDNKVFYTKDDVKGIQDLIPRKVFL